MSVPFGTNPEQIYDEPRCDYDIIITQKAYCTTRRVRLNLWERLVGTGVRVQYDCDVHVVDIEANDLMSITKKLLP